MAQLHHVSGLEMAVINRCAAFIIAASLSVSAFADGVSVDNADCPLARMPYSVDTPLLDLITDPRSKEMLLKILPSAPAFGIKPPSLSAIISPRTMIKQFAFPVTSEALEELDHALNAIPITDEAVIARCARYDHVPPELPLPQKHPAMLVFEKITGFRDAPSVDAARKALSDSAEKRGWSLTFTDNGAVFNAQQLKNYDAIIWNNISGDALTVPQQDAFKSYLQQGGGYVGIHGSAGDFVYPWHWYVDTLIGAQFIGHPMNPQFQNATVTTYSSPSGITEGLPNQWSMTEEWYSFASNPKAKGAHILVTIDETTYNPVPALKMGAEHPIAWTQCIENGRTFYSAIGHRPESYTEPNSARLLEQGIAWAAGAGKTRCQSGKEVEQKVSAHHH